MDLLKVLEREAALGDEVVAKMAEDYERNLANSEDRTEVRAHYKFLDGTVVQGDWFETHPDNALVLALFGERLLTSHDAFVLNLGEVVVAVSVEALASIAVQIGKPDESEGGIWAAFE